MKMYWSFVQQLLKEKYGGKDPEEWSNQMILTFMDDMEAKLLEDFRQDQRKAKTCKLELKGDKLYTDNIHNQRLVDPLIDPKTFNRIFKEKTGGAQKRIQNSFAIFLGYDSAMDLLQKQSSMNNTNATEKRVNTTQLKGQLNTGFNSKAFNGVLMLMALAGLFYLLLKEGVQVLMNPFVLAGGAMILFFGIHRVIINSKLLPEVEKADSSLIMRIILRYGFLIALVAIVGGVVSSSMGFWRQKQRSEVGFEAIKEQVLGDITEMAFLINSVERFEVEPFFEKRHYLDTPHQYQNKVKEHYKSNVDDLKYVLDKYPLNEATFDAYKNSLIKADQATGFQKGYKNLQKTRTELYELIEQWNALLQSNQENEEYAKHFQLKQQLKLTQAKIAFAQANSEFVQLLDGEVDRYSIRQALQAAGFTVEGQDNKAIWQSLQAQTATLYQLKTSLVAQSAPYPILTQQTNNPADTVEPTFEEVLAETDSLIEQFNRNGSILSKEEFLHQEEAKAVRKVNKKLYNPYLCYIRQISGLPCDKLTDSEKWKIEKTPLNREETDAGKLLEMANEAFYRADEEAITFYLQRATQAKGLSAIQRIYLERSLERMKQPDLYGNSIGVMVLKVLDEGALKAAGIKAGDVIYKMNGELIQEPYDISELLIGKLDGDTHQIDFYRDGRPRSKAVGANQVLGVQLSQLILWRPTQI